jgi:hypothetical protein
MVNNLYHLFSMIQKLVNVYQLYYKNGPAQGFGDYLRGCFCLYQISNLLKIPFDMDLSKHPMAKYLKNAAPCPGIHYELVEKYLDANYIRINEKHHTQNSRKFLIEFIKHLSKQHHLGLFCNSFPIFNTISDCSIEFIKNKIEPCDQMQKHIDDYICKLQLIKKEYTVIHVRSGDDILFNSNININHKYITTLLDIIKKYNPSEKCIILSDSNKVKTLLKERNPSFIIDNKLIGHLGTKNGLSDPVIIDTLLDFYLMSHAAKILSISPYSWGSGFSQWCSVIYKIPYSKVIY